MLPKQQKSTLIGSGDMTVSQGDALSKIGPNFSTITMTPTTFGPRPPGTAQRPTALESRYCRT